MPSLVSKGLKTYREEGLSTFVVRTGRFARNTYRDLVHRYLRPAFPARSKNIELNGVDVPVDVTVLDDVVPFYTPPYPTVDNANYEHTEAQALRQYCQSGDDVVVVGGGLGVTAVIAAEAVGPDGHVTVFEASQSTCEMTEKTVRTNGYSDRITVECAAIGDLKGSNYTHREPDAKRLVRPDELPPADVYEIDCEGSEVSVLRDMTIRPRNVLVETHDNHDTVAGILEDIGYQIEEVVTDGLAQAPHCTHIRAAYRESTADR